MNQTSKENNLTFWEHLDQLRSCLIRIVIVVLLFSIVAFVFKDILFTIVFAPRDSNFITYRLFAKFVDDLPTFSVNLINTGLAQQFMAHLKVAMWAGVLCASPYILYVLFGFISPALYSSEKKYAFKAVCGGYVMFMLGVLLNYFLIFPLTFRFLGTYQVSSDVANLISLDSYISTFVMLSLMLGIVFEIPILCWILAKFGLMSSRLMKKYRRHAIVIILVVAAIITPTADVFTLSLVAVPIYMLFEISILIVKRIERKQIAEQ